jgi:hypothetical protein
LSPLVIERRSPRQETAGETPMLRWTCLAILATFVFESTVAHALALVCPPNPTIAWVGDTASNSQCQYATLHEAVAGLGTGTCPAQIVITVPLVNEHATITNKNLTLLGSSGPCGSSVCSDPDSCPSNPPTGSLQTITGSDPAAFGILSIEGNSNVTVRYLTLRNSNSMAIGTYGGAIEVLGNSRLTLDHSSLLHNSAYYGGAIALLSGRVDIADNVAIENNAAVDGGGIYIEGGDATFTGDSSTIAFNTAERYGGGIAVTYGTVTVSSPGFHGVLGLDAISHNTGTHGGGIAVLSNAGGVMAVSPTAFVYTKDARFGTTISHNSATENGGGVYLESLSSVGAMPPPPRLCAYDVRITDNGAPDGSAIYADSTNNAIINFNGMADAQQAENCPTSRPIGGVACAPGVRCNEIDNNYGIATNGSRIGAPIGLQGNSTFDATTLNLNHNIGKHLFGSSSAIVNIDNCLMTDNEAAMSLLFSDSITAGAAHINGCTIANNSIAGANTIDWSRELHLSIDIVDQPANSTVKCCATNEADGVLVSDGANVTGIHVVEGEPTFVNAAAGDYRLAVTCLTFNAAGACTNGFSASAGIDQGFWYPTTTPNDIAGRARDIDIAGVDNEDEHASDIGAFEMQPIADRVFVDAFGDPVLMVF